MNSGNWFALAAISALALAPVDARAAEATPFRGRITGTFVATPTANPTIFNSVASARGNGTHIGAFTKITADVLNVATGQNDGTFTMTAANGDQINGRYSGIIVLTSPTTFSWNLPATITGGTGRFAGASGTFTFSASGRFASVNGELRGDYEETYEGTITVPDRRTR